ncbi:Fimbrial protein precursor [Microbulbifer aggregans]|uniref:Fimbrial protein n=1 Tax=Microbulbifer aggregans TaxID=1769779 RepID=A0A1C9W8P1_9GAMM|nr:type IV pilin protein [Microbulbifer aggregans]AOS97523.1 Fimbrial protein precursor [Microbulbifer aggregans]
MNSKGFTLIELMIAVAIVAILAAIAVPSYQDSVRKSRRSDATAALLRLQLEQEKLRANCRFYAGTLAGAESCGTDAASSSLNFSTASEKGFYNISVTAASGNGYTITADPTGSQAADTDCDPIQYVYPAGTKTPAGCWD